MSSNIYILLFILIDECDF